MNTRNYELMLVLSPELDESALEALIDRIKLFLDNAQVQVLSFKSWGLRRLAYVILGNREGRYYLVHFTADPEKCTELERNFTLTDGIIRHLLTRIEVIPADEPVAVEPVTVEPVAVETVEVETVAPAAVVDVVLEEPAVDSDESAPEQEDDSTPVSE